MTFCMTKIITLKNKCWNKINLDWNALSPVRCRFFGSPTSSTAHIAWFKTKWQIFTIALCTASYIGIRSFVFGAMRYILKYYLISIRVPDPHGSALIWVAGSGSGSAFKLRIRIQIQEGKNDPQKYKKVQNFHVFKNWSSLLRAEGFSCSLGVLYGGLGISKL